MAVEVEKKYRLTKGEAAAIADDLAEMGAEFIGEDFEENIIFGGELLAGRNAILRVRKIEAKCLLTYKQRIETASDIKHQLEEETEVADAESILRILDSLGFQRRVVYEKRRRTWRFRNTEVMLDELPFGLFAEIEGSLMAIREAELILGLDDVLTEHKTYPVLAAEFGIRRGEKIEARF